MPLNISHLPYGSKSKFVFHCHVSLIWNVQTPESCSDTGLEDTDCDAAANKSWQKSICARDLKARNREKALND